MSNEQVVIVGAGIAGCSAALEAARSGLSVALIDEHPQSIPAMSLDAPYFYGARLPAVLSDSSAIADRVLGANEMLLECLDAGVDVMTGTCVWGNFVPGPNSQSTQKMRLGLADSERSWIITYEDLIVAAGARDLVLSFPGWHLPGVLGAAAAGALVGRYQALGGNRAIILGSGNTALRLAKQFIDSGIEVAGIVDVCADVRGDPALRIALERAGIRFLLATVISSVIGEREVEGVELRRIGQNLQPTNDPALRIECDTVCMAYGLVPNIELPAQTGCALVYRSSHGGWVPSVNDLMCSSHPSIYVVGDAAGVREPMILDPSLAAEQGRRAAAAIAAGKSGAGALQPAPRTEPMQYSSLTAGQQWLRALVAVSGLDVIVCQCEEVTRRDLQESRPPRSVPLTASTGIRQLTGPSRSNQDLVKRITRAGMGHCQGKRCREQTAMLLAEAACSSLAAVPPATYRPPIRPLPLAVLAENEETPEMRKNWPTWFHAINEGEIG